jgi:hypothetical protein
MNLEIKRVDNKWTYDEVELFIMTLYEDLEYDHVEKNFSPLVFIGDATGPDLDTICLGGARCVQRLSVWIKELYGANVYCESYRKIYKILDDVAAHCPDWQDRARRYLEKVKLEAQGRVEE